MRVLLSPPGKPRPLTQLVCAPIGDPAIVTFPSARTELTSHRYIICQLPVTSVLLSGLNARLPLGPAFNGSPIDSPVSGFHRRTVPSLLPEARSLPSGLKVTDVTWPECPESNVCSLVVSFRRMR